MWVNVVYVVCAASLVSVARVFLSNWSECGCGPDAFSGCKELYCYLCTSCKPWQGRTQESETVKEIKALGDAGYAVSRKRHNAMGL